MSQKRQCYEALAWLCYQGQADALDYCIEQAQIALLQLMIERQERAERRVFVQRTPGGEWERISVIW